VADALDDFQGGPKPPDRISKAGPNCNGGQTPSRAYGGMPKFPCRRLRRAPNPMADFERMGAQKPVDPPPQHGAQSPINGFKREPITHRWFAAQKPKSAKLTSMAGLSTLDGRFVILVGRIIWKSVIIDSTWA